MKVIIISLLLLCSSLCQAQNKTPTEQEAREFFAKTDEMLLTSITVFEEEDGELYELYARKNPGDILITGTTVYKIIRNGESTVYNCSMIEFNAMKHDPKEIERIQKTIIASYNFGISFEELAGKYATPETTFLNVNLDTDSLHGPRKTEIETHEPKEIFVVKFGDSFSSLMVINNPPVKVKSVMYYEAEYK